jgi:hypothetical protein
MVGSIEGWDPASSARLDRLMRGDETVSSEKAEKFKFEHQFKKFLKLHPEWSEVGAAVLFWRSYDQNFHEKMLVMRKQMSGLCFMHAPVLLQHYLVSIYKIKNKQALDFKMIDVAVYIKDHWRGPVLAQYLLYNRGGSAVDFFGKINNIPISYRRYIF